MTNPIIEEVRRIRKVIESENNNDWDTIEEYLSEKQAERTTRPVTYKPQKLPDRGVA
ncbi:MAG: hypothetical protein IIB17_12610 [Chloroflexi bacterium]|nr:hypothetical protein [Chloroflexota bacterium]